MKEQGPKRESVDFGKIRRERQELPKRRNADITREETLQADDLARGFLQDAPNADPEVAFRIGLGLVHPGANSAEVHRDQVIGRTRRNWLDSGSGATFRAAHPELFDRESIDPQEASHRIHMTPEPSPIKPVSLLDFAPQTSKDSTDY